MKNIGLITRSHVSNYGSFLQTYASLAMLNKNNIATLIQYIPTSENKHSFHKLYFTKHPTFPFYKKLLYKFFRCPDLILAFNSMQKLRKKYMHMTDVIYNENTINELSGKFDILVAGSDQLWGSIGTDDSIDPNYFLCFDNKAIKCSMSSSFGKIPTSKDNIKKIGSLLSNFKYITVREKSAMEFLHNEFPELKVNQILDPTLFIGIDFWNKELERHKFKKIRKPYVLLYNIHSQKKLGQMAYKYAKTHNLKLINVSPTFFRKDHSGHCLRTADPFLFLYLIKNASLVITNSFHATVFSSLFNTQFKVFNPGPTASRIIDFVTQYKLETAYYDNLDKEINESQINFVYFNNLIAKQRDLN